MGSGQQHACIYLCISLYRRCGHTRLQCCTRRPIYSFCSHQLGMNSKCIYIYIYMECLPLLGMPWGIASVRNKMDLSMRCALVLRPLLGNKMRKAVRSAGGIDG